MNEFHNSENDSENITNFEKFNLKKKHLKSIMSFQGKNKNKFKSFIFIVIITVINASKAKGFYFCFHI